MRPSLDDLDLMSEFGDLPNDDEWIEADIPELARFEQDVDKKVSFISCYTQT